MILEHYSKEPLAWPPRDVQQGNVFCDGSFKPNGLWVSVKGEDDWLWWCRAEGFRPERLTHCTRIHLRDDAKIKLIQGEEALLAFNEEFGFDWAIGDSGFSLRRIDWPRLAESFDGVIIAPYVWSCRLGHIFQEDRNDKRVSDWYYPWDCASGCIWNGTKAIQRFEPVEITETEKEKAA